MKLHNVLLLQIAAHVEKDCALTIISCPYAQMGCSQKVISNKGNKKYRTHRRYLYWENFFEIGYYWKAVHCKTVSVSVKISESEVQKFSWARPAHVHGMFTAHVHGLRMFTRRTDSLKSIKLDYHYLYVLLKTMAIPFWDCLVVTCVK